MTKRSLLTTVFLILLVLLALYISIPRSVPALARWLIDNDSARLTALEIGYPRFGNVEIEELTIDLRGIGRLSLQQGLIQYSPLTIRFDRLLHQASGYFTDPVATDAPSPQITTELLPDFWLEKIPDIEIDVRDSYSALSPEMLSDFSLIKKQRAINVSGFIQHDFFKQPTRQQFFIQVQDDWIKLEIAEDDETIILFSEISITEKPQFFAVDIAMQLSLNPFFTAYLDGVDDGRLLINIETALEKEFISIEDIFSENIAWSTDLMANLKDKHWLTAQISGYADIGQRITLSAFENNDGREIIFNNGEDEFSLSLDKFSVTLPKAFTHLSNFSFENDFYAELFFKKQALGSVALNAIQTDSENQQIYFAFQSKIKSKGINQLVQPLLATDARIAADITLNSNQLSIDLTEDISLNAHPDLLEQGSFTQTNLVVPKQAIAIHFKQPRPVSVTLRTNSRYQQHPLTALVNAQVDYINGEAAITAQSGNIALEDFYLPVYTADIFLNWAQNPQMVLTLANRCKQPLLTAAWDKQSQFANLEIKKQFSEQDSFKQWLNIADLPANLIAGELNVKASYHTNTSVMDIALTLQDAVAVTAAGQFNDIQLSFSSSSLDSLPSNQRLDFSGSVLSANVGTVITDMLLKGSLITGSARGHTLDIEQATANLLGGSVQLTLGETKKERQYFTIGIDNLDIGQLIASQQLQGLDATGRVSGELPFYYQQGQLFLEQGKVFNKAGGKIVYQSPLQQEADINPQLKSTLDILENFNYDNLSTQISLNNESLLLASTITGNNPDVQSGRAVVLNLNTDLPWQSAFQAMRLKADIDSLVEQYVDLGVDTDSYADICYGD